MAGLDLNTKLLFHFNGPNGTEEIIDSGNTGHVITQVATAQLATSTKKFGSTSLFLDGNSDAVTIPDDPDFAFGTGDFTIEAFVKINALGSIQHIYHKRTGISSKELQIFVNSSNQIEFSTDDGTDIRATSAGTLTTGSFFHIACVRDAGTLRIFINGVADGTASGTIQDVTSTGLLFIGQNTSGTTFFGGNVDEYRISNNARFTSGFTSIKTEYISDVNTKLLLHLNTQDVSGNGSSGVYHIPDFIGTAQLDTSEKQFGQSSIFFDGNSDYIILPDSSDWDIFATATEDWTIDLWVNHDGDSNDDGLVEHFQNSNNLWTLRLNGAEPVKNINFLIVQSGVILQVNSTTFVPSNQWVHIALVKRADEYALYQDGVQVAYTQDSSTANFTGSLYIGTRVGGSLGFLDGNMDEIRIQKSNAFDITIASSDPGGNWMDNTGSNLGTILVPSSEYSFVGATPSSDNIRYNKITGKHERVNDVRADQNIDFFSGEHPKNFDKQ